MIEGLHVLVALDAVVETHEPRAIQAGLIVEIVGFIVHESETIDQMIATRERVLQSILACTDVLWQEKVNGVHLQTNGQ